MLTYDHRLMKGLMTPLHETWVIDEGQAWYVWELMTTGRPLQNFHKGAFGCQG